MIEIIDFKMINKGNLIAKFTAKMHKWGGLLIRECTYFESKDKKWINLPSKQYESEGKTKYFSYLAYEDREIDNKLKDSIRKACDEFMEKQISQNQKVKENIDEIPF